MTKALVHPAQKFVFFIATVAVALSLSFAIAPAPARAATLTEGQIQSVLGLLVAFNVDAAVIHDVDLELHGQTTVVPPTNTAFSVSPTSGAAPLSVTFSSTIGGSINFGDGSSGVMSAANNCAYLNCGNTTYVASHTYSIHGTYLATLTNSGACAQGYCTHTVGTLTITVSGSQTDGSVTFAATPSSGAAPLNVSFNSNTAGTVNFGDGTSGTMNALPTCASCGPSYSQSHTYSTAGSYTATLTNGNYTCTGNSPCPPNQLLATATVTVTSGNNSPPTLTASPSSGAAPLNVFFNSNTPGTVSFGDGSSGTMNPAPTCASCGPAYTQSHTYTAAGTYRPSLTNGSLILMTTVQVSNGGLDAAPFCSVTYTPSTFTTGQPFTIDWAATNAVSRTYGVYNSSGALIAGPYTTTVSGHKEGSSFSDLPAGSYVRQDTVTSASGATGTCQRALTVAAPSQTAPTLTAQPASGSVPLSVVFTTNVAGGTVDFGDGTTASVAANCTNGTNGGGSCATGSYFTSHTYQSAGTYMAQLISGCQDSVPGCPTHVIASVTVTVTGANTGGTFTASPTSGAAPLSVNFTGVGNSISFGDNLGQVATDNGLIGGTTHTYQSAGTYTATSNNSSITITVTQTTGGGTTGSGLSANPTSGAAPLAVTFTVQHTSNTGNVCPTLSFGDGSSQAGCPSAGVGGNPSYNVSHTYSSPGTYTAGTTGGFSYDPHGTVTIVVTGHSGLSAALDPSSLVAAAVMAPFALMIDSLANIFVLFGVGQ